MDWDCPGPEDREAGAGGKETEKNWLGQYVENHREYQVPETTESREGVRACVTAPGKQTYKTALLHKRMPDYPGRLSNQALITASI